MSDSVPVDPQGSAPVAPSASPFHQEARDNSGNVLSPLQTHTQKPDVTAAQRRGAISDAQYDNLPLDQRDKYALIRKGPDGGQEWVARDQLGADPATAVPTGDRHKFGEMEFSEQELRDFLTSKADAELRKASLPASPGDYKAALPDSFKLPDGVTFEINEADPALADARVWAHKQGFSQAQFGEMLSLHASMQAREAATLNAARAAEVEKLGVNGAQRVTALETWLRGMVGDKLAGPMRLMMCTADIVKGLETLQHKFSSQGSASFSQAHREPASPQGRVDEATYANMSPGQKLDYARSFDQRQFQR